MPNYHEAILALINMHGSLEEHPDAYDTTSINE